MFNTLKNPNTSKQKRADIFSSLLKEIEKRASYGHYNGGKLLYLSGLVNSIAESMNDPSASEYVLGSYFQMFEIEYKKFMYIFKLEGNDTYLKNVVRSHLNKKEYQIAEKEIENFPYYITLTFDDKMEYTPNTFPVESYINFIYYPNIHYYINLNRYNALDNSDVQGVITGLSYSYYAVNPEMFSDTLAVLAVPSQDLFYDFEMLKKHTKTTEILSNM